MKMDLKKGLITLIVLLTAACSTTSAASGTSKAPDVFEGFGKDASYLGAINNAKRDALKKAVLAMLGDKQEQLYREKLNVAIYNTNNPDQYLFKETLENINRDKEGELQTFQIRVRVDLEAIRNLLRAYEVVFDGTAPAGSASVASTGSTSTLSPDAQRARDLIRGEGATAAASTGAGTSGTSGTNGSAGTTGATTIAATDADWGKATDEEAKLIRKYVDTMTYMVYFNEESNESKELMRAAVSMANRYLANNTMEAIDISQIEKLKEDQRQVFEEEAGKDVGFIQWIAQKLNAGVYIEINSTSTGETVNNRHFGQVNLDIKLYDPSTAQLLGSVPFNSQKAFSQSSQLDAKINAMQSSIFTIMPMAIDQSKNYMAKALTRGIKYDLVIQATSDSRLMSQFRRKMQTIAKQINVVSSSPEETKYEVYFVGTTADLEDAIYGITESIPGLEGLYQVMIRGKSLTFNTGL